MPKSERLPTCHVLPVFLTACSVLVSTSTILVAEDVWYAVPFEDLNITEGEVGKLPETRATENRIAFSMRTRLILDGPGTAWAGRQVGMQNSVGFVNSIKEIPHEEKTIVVRAPEGQAVSGIMRLPNEDWSGVQEVRFRIAPELADQKYRDVFLKTQQFWYQTFLNYHIAGKAWFRQRALETALQQGIRPDKSLPQDSRFHSNSLWFGTRSVSDSLALDRLLARPDSEPHDVDPQTVPGIVPLKIDWSEFPQLDEAVPAPLAEKIPVDQYAIFFSSFQDYVNLITEVGRSSAPFLDTISPSIEDDRTLELYETQLCLPLGDVAKAVGGQLIGSLAVTGSDPYLRGGSEVAVLLQTKAPGVLHAAVVANQQQAVRSEKGCRATSGEFVGIKWNAVVSPRRNVSSYVMQVGDVVIVTNSLRQVEHLTQVMRGELPAMNSLDEYKFLRASFKRSDDETALMIVPEAAIVQWSGAADRIASTRRVYAAAVLADETARHMDELVAGVEQSRTITPRYIVPNMGPLKLTKQGVMDETYGNTGFLTPVSELRPDLVSKSEVTAYEAWKKDYQKYWRQTINAIGVRLSITKKIVGMDMVVVPKVGAFPYGFFYGFTSKHSFEPASGQRHAESILHLAAASPVVLQYVIGPGFSKHYDKAMTGPVSFYCDDGPFWKEYAEHKFGFNFMMDNLSRAPFALSVGVTDAKKIEEELNSFVAKKQVTVEVHEYRGYTWYDRRPAGGRKQDFAFLNYLPNVVVLPDSMHVSPNPDMITAAIDRFVEGQQAAKQGEPPAVDVPEWIGQNVALQLRPPVGIFDGFLHQQLEQRLRGQSWGNLEILNEWKSRYPAGDAVGLHERIWKSRLRCPAGGTYVWNENFQTYESTVFGHPADQRSPKDLKPLSVYHAMKRANFGLSLTEFAVRFRVEIER